MFKGQRDNTKRHQNYTAIVFNFRTVSWSNYSYPTGVVNQFTCPTFPLPETTVFKE